MSDFFVNNQNPKWVYLLGIPKITCLLLLSVPESYKLSIDILKKGYVLMNSSPKINTRLLTLQYCILQGSYWATFCAVYAFSTVLLLSKGFTSSQVGITVALGNILGVILQPIFAGIADSSKRISLQKLTAFLCAVTALFFVLVYLLPNIFFGIAACFLLTDTFLQVTQPLVNSVSIYYVNQGISVDFGIARAVGSISYAAVSSALGYLIEQRGTNIIIFSGLLFLAIIVLALLSMPVLKEKSSETHTAPENSANSVVKEPLWHFFARYKRFTVALLGVTLLFTFHNMTNSYLIQIVQSLGGDSANMGTALSIAAISELPAMLIFSKLLKRFRSNQLLIISGFFFAIKAASYLLAGTVFQFYLTQILQMGAFALYIPASVYYVNETMESADKFKGQAVMTATNTLGGVIGSLLGGFLLDYTGITPLLSTGFILAAGGAVLLLFSCSHAKSTTNTTA